MLNLMLSKTEDMQEMIFEHDYARRKYTLQVVYIEYIDGQPHSVTASHDGIQCHFDFESDCKQAQLFMFYHSGSGGTITELQAPHFVDGGNAAYWMHPDTSFKAGTDAINATRLNAPIEYEGKPNPFDNGREVYGQDYCDVCGVWYDEDACPDHHTVNDEGELVYIDGRNIDN